jgi:DNA-binding NarL/FixJ family response regulator
MSVTRIVVADDHTLIRSGIVKLVHDVLNSCDVVEACSGAELFEALAQKPVHCLLLDLNMPGFEPITSLKQIRAMYPDIPILVITAYDDPIYVQALLEAGVRGYHIKSQPLSELRIALERVLAGERWIAGPVIERLLEPQTTISLTERQRILLELLCQGLDNISMAHELFLSVKTIENNLTRLYRRLGVSSRLEAVRFANEHPHILAELDQITVSKSKHAVLLVDDSLNYRRQLKRVIQRTRDDLNFHEASNTNDAMSIIGKHNPHLVLVDMLLGEESGIECVRQARGALPNARIILISAYPDREFHRQGLAAGASAFIDKRDLDAAAVRQIIKDAVDTS